MIQEKENIDYYNQRMVFAGKELEDSQTIGDYNTCLTSAQIECGKVDPIAVTAVPQHKYVGCGNSGTKAPADCYVDDDGVYYVVDSDAAQNTITLTNSGETFQARLATVFGSASNWDPNAEVVEGGHMMALDCGPTGLKLAMPFLERMRGR